MFPKFLRTFLLILAFHARLVVAVPGTPQECGEAAGGGRSEGASPWRSQAMEDLLWSSWAFLRKQLPRNSVPTDSGLSASSANHSPPLASFLATCGQCLAWDGWFLSSKSRSGCSCFNEHVVLVCGQGGGLSIPDGTLSGATCPHSGHFRLLGHHCWVSAALLSPPLATGNQLMAARKSRGDECGSWGKLCCPHLTWTTASKY